MQKPNGYDETMVQGEYIPVELGGHYAYIKQVSEQKSSKGQDMIVVLFDFAREDNQAGYFTAAYDNDTREDRKWPFNGKKYIMVMDYKDPSKTSRAFKTFCSHVENSNANFEIQWDGSGWGKQFVGKKIGVVFGEEENEYEGKISMRHVPKWFCKWENVASAAIPEPKYIGNKPELPPTPQDANGFMNIPEGADEEIPF